MSARRLQQEHHVAILALVALLLAFGFAALDQYDITWDEGLGDLFFGQRYLSYWTSQDSRYLDFNADPYPADHLPNLASSPFRNRPWEYYPFANVLAAASAELFSSRLSLMDWFDGFHALNLLLAALFVPVWFRFLLQQVGETEALLGVLLLFTAPRVVVHMLANTKDFPETIFFALAAVLFFDAWERGSRGGIVGAGLVGGAALATKANALFLAPVLGLTLLVARPPEAFEGKARKLLVAVVIATLAGALLFIGSWPYLWAAPLERLQRHFSYIAGQVHQVRHESLLSPYQALLYTTPLSWLLLAVVGLWPAVRGAIRREGLPVLTLAWVGVTLGRLALPGAVNFDGVRHFLEIFPALALLGAMGGGQLIRWLDRIRSRWPARGREVLAQRLLAATVLLVAVVPQAWATVRSHPHQIAYWNQLVGGTSGAFERGLPQAGDYWGLGYRQGLRWLDQHAEQRALLAVPMVEHSVLLVSQTRLRKDIGLLHLSSPASPEIPAAAVTRLRQLASQQPVYVLFAWRADWSNRLIEDCRQRLRPVAEWSLDGVPLVQIYRYH